MTCDGDSKTFSSVEDTYPDCKVEKPDCVGHVQKRMGKHLLKLKAETKEKLKDGKTIGRKERLTEEKIKKLHKDYGLAIRQNRISKPFPSEKEIYVAVYQMKKNIIALLHHNVSSENLAKQHRFGIEEATSVFRQFLLLPRTSCFPKIPRYFCFCYSKVQP